MAFGFLDAIPVAASVFGGFDAQRRAKNAAEERAKVLRDYEALINQDYSNAIGNTNQNVLSETGLLGDALRTYGANAGAANAAAGIYNSSATAGDISRVAQTGQQTLADMALRGKQGADQILSSGRRFLLGQKLGIADNNYNDSRENLNSAQGGLVSGLSSLAQRLYQQNVGQAPGGGRNSVLDPARPITLSGQGLVPTVPGMGSSSYGSGNISLPNQNWNFGNGALSQKRPALFGNALPAFSY